MVVSWALQDNKTNKKNQGFHLDWEGAAIMIPSVNHFDYKKVDASRKEKLEATERGKIMLQSEAISLPSSID